MIEANRAFCDKHGKIKPMSTSTPPTLPHSDMVLCHWDDLPDGQAILRKDLILLRSGERIRAFINRCAHFGVPLAAKESQLIFTPHRHITCNIHYARYRWEDGICDTGECRGESLTPVTVHVAANGDICTPYNPSTTSSTR